MSSAAVSTRCRGWVMTRADGATLGFTDHDRALSFADPVRGAVVLEPATGFTPSAFAESVGLASSDMDIEGAISSDNITAQDLANGVYDGAEVRFYWIDWSNTAFFDLLSVSRVAEIVRNQSSFSATIEGLSAKASDPVGLRITRECTLEFGSEISARNGQGCGIDLADPAYSESGAVSWVHSTRSFAISNFTLAAGLCNFGKIKWITGANAGAVSTIKSHTVRGLESIIELDLAPAGEIALTDTFTAEVGCDKGKANCKSFGNIARRLAFDVPSDDVATKYARNLGDDGASSGSGSSAPSGYSVVKDD